MVPLNHEKKRYRKKAGIFIYDPETKKVLLVQSRGRLWGPPKGTIKDNELDKDCAIREVKEETGINILESNFLKIMRIKNNAIYYYVEMKECNVNIQDHIKQKEKTKSKKQITFTLSKSFLYLRLFPRPQLLIG